LYPFYKRVRPPMCVDKGIDVNNGNIDASGKGCLTNMLVFYSSSYLRP